jgi:hypothetical protein
MIVGDRDHSPEIAIDFGANARFYPTRLTVDASFPAQPNHPPPKVLTFPGHKDDKVEVFFMLRFGEGASSIVREVTPSSAFQKFQFIMTEPSAGDQWIMRIQRIELHGFFVGWWT